MKSPTESEVFRRFFHAWILFLSLLCSFSRYHPFRFLPSILRLKSIVWCWTCCANRQCTTIQDISFRGSVSSFKYFRNNVWSEGGEMVTAATTGYVSMFWSARSAVSIVKENRQWHVSNDVFFSNAVTVYTCNERNPHRGGPISKRFPPLLVTLKMAGCFSLLFCGLRFGNTHDHASANHGYRGRWIPSWRRRAARTMAASRSARRTFNRFVTARSWVPENEGL